MKFYDITQEVFSGRVYPGDPRPEYVRALKITEGAPCNLTSFSMGAHNGTHMDSPYHFIEQGKPIDQIELSRCIGPCTVVTLRNQDLEGLREILSKSHKRLIFKGDDIVTIEVAKLLNEFKIELVGIESQSFGPVGQPMEVHLELLSQDVLLLEGLVLNEVSEGEYFLFAAPLKLGGSDGAPCRAILMEGSLSE
ncbi:MAG: cyclase family protein [Herbinix sp.]|jgi:arylformamidase|nr:cyclase family protein [Herbinix sp.]